MNIQTLDMQLSDRINNMEESATIKMAQMARDLAAQGKKVISLSLGEPDFDTPEHIKEAAIEALKAGFTKYTPVPGLMELRQAVCTKLKRDNGLDYTPNQIVVSNGAKQCIANLCLALLQEGDEALILAPYWVSYKEIVALSEAKATFVAAGLEQDFKVNATQLRAALTEKTRMLIYSSPCNPTGSVFTKEELASFVEVLKDFPNVIVVSDEIYEYINFTKEGHASIASFDEIKDRVVIVNGFSKGFAMTGWRLGYMAAPQWIASACAKMQGQFTSGAASFSQKAAAYALLSDMTPTLTMLEAFRKRRDLITELLSQVEGINVNHPTGAFYVFPDVSFYFGKTDGKTIVKDANDFCEYLLFEANVAIVGGDAFGDDNCVRLSYALSEENIREAVRRIAEAVARLK